jgi:hypothetical protein
MNAAATTAQAIGNSDRPTAPRVRLVGWRAITEGSQRGFATIELPLGLRIHDAPVFIGKKGPWESPPNKPMVAREGRQKIGADGKAVLAPVLEWRSHKLSDRFSSSVVALVTAAHFCAFDGDSP